MAYNLKGDIFACWLPGPEGEIYRLAMAETHLRDDETFELGLEDLIGYGFDTRTA
jgi:hypothetical protein